MSDDNKTPTNNDAPVVFPLSDRELRVRNQELADLVARAQAALDDCTNFADKYHLSFSWGPAYGMGGYYYGDPADRNSEYSEGGWRSSSSSC